MATTKSTVTLSMTEEQAALLRQLVFRDLCQAADALSEQADEAGNTTSSSVVGEDAEGTYRLNLMHTCDLLDMIGWSTSGDAERLIDLDRQRRELMERDA